MGFYGNISNVNRTQFSFDRIYSSRKAMEQARIGDGVYLGRFVLVEYDDRGLDGLQQVYRKNDGINILYQDSSCTIKLTKSAMVDHPVVYVLENEVYSFYRCTSDFDADSTDAATFEVINEITPNAPAYTRNYFIDTKEYGAGRGYDSTVWQKVYVDGNEKYVMIAELNTVVPKFEVAADAPTMNPIAPHFDTQSTDVYYKLHVQTPWGFRVAAASNPSHSDSETTWTTYVYKDNGVHEERTEKKNAAIYFNKAGFNKNNPSHVDGENEIKLTLASSGRAIYDDHDNNTRDTVASNDIQELTINLPEIGNMMSDAWNIIHGPNRDNARTDANSSLQGRLDSFDAFYDNQIPIKRATDGTIIGSRINGASNYDADIDLLTLPEGANGTVTGFTGDDAWIETKINTATLKAGDKESDDDQANNSGISIHHTFHATQNSTSTVDKNNGSKATGDNYKQAHIRSTNSHHNDDDEIDLYVPYVDAKGHVVGHNIETVTLPYGFKTIATNGRSNEASENATGTPVTTNVVANTTQDTLAINSGNKWIRIDTDVSGDSLTIRHDVHETSSDKATTDWTKTETDTTIPVMAYEYDEAGHYTKHHIENYKLPFGYGKIKGDSGNTAATATYDELTFTSDEWLTATVDKDKVTYSHNYPDIDTSDRNETNINASVDNKIQNTINIPDWSYDNAGHITGKHNHTYILPYGYKTFTGDSGTTSANNTQDTMAVTGDDWVQTTVGDNKIAIVHIGPVSGDVTEVSNETPVFGATFSIDDHYFDEKGHKFTSKKHTVQIPLPSLTNGTGNVVTELSLVPETGAFTTTKNNISKLLLTDYSKKTNNDDIAATDALGDALSKLQTQIHDTETVISNLDYNEETANNTQIITQITQTDGKITNVARAAAGTLVLGEGYSKAATGEALATSDSLNTAFGKIEKSLEDTNTRITNLIGGENLNEAFDTLKEVSDWLATNDTGADKIIDDIAILNGADTVEGSVAHSIKQAIDIEITDRNNAIGTAIEGLDVSDTAEDGKYVSQVTQTNGKIAVVRASLPTYTLTPGESNGTVKFNDNEVSVTGLGSAAYTNSDDYVLVSRYNTDLSTKDAQINGLNFEAKRLTNEVNTITSSLDNYVTKEQYELDLATKDAQINGLNFEAKRLTNEVNALTAKVQSLEEIITKLIENIPTE